MRALRRQQSLIAGESILLYNHVKNERALPLVTSEILKTMLKESLHTDFTFVGTDGFEAKCHMGVLGAEIPFFREMFQRPEWVNGQSQRLTVDGNQGDLEAFLQYVYCKELMPMIKDFETTISVMRLAKIFDYEMLLDDIALIMSFFDHPRKHLDKATTYGNIASWVTVLCCVQDWPERFKRSIHASTVNVLKRALRNSSNERVLEISGGDLAIAAILNALVAVST